MGQYIAGGILGSLTSLLDFGAQNRALKQQANLSEKQYQATKLAYENEQQERAKTTGKDADLEALLDSNTASARAATDLTGGKVKKTKLFNSGSSVLGVSGNAGGY